MDRLTTVYQSGNSLAVRLVGECRLPRGTRVRETREGTRIVIEPVAEWSKAFKAALGSVRGAIPRPRGGKARDPFA